jgi:DNA-binding transcriptional LysR family regulator
MQLAQLEAFLKVAWEGSFTRAALALNVAQSSVSARISALEKDLGEKLLMRLGSRVELTPAGRALLPYAEEMTNMMLRAREGVRTASRLSHEAVCLRIGSNGSSSLALVPKVINEFHRLRPDVRIVIEVDRTSGLMPQLMEGAISLAFVNPHLTHPLTEVLWSRRVPCLLVGRAGRWRPHSKVRIADLRKERFVTYTLGPALEATQRLNSLLDQCLRISVESSSTHLVRTAIGAGLGIGFLPLDAVEREINDGSLAEICLADFEAEPWDVVLVRWRGKPVSAVTDKFVEMLRSGLLLRQHQPPDAVVVKIEKIDLIDSPRR